MISVERPTNRPQPSLRCRLRTRSPIANMIIVGVTDGYQRSLEIQGVGSRAAARARTSGARLFASGLSDRGLPRGINLNPSRRRSSSRVDKRRSARSRQTSARAVPPSPRARRASVTAANTSPGRSARKEHPLPAAREGRTAATGSGPGVRNRPWPPPVRVPVQPWRFRQLIDVDGRTLAAAELDRARAQSSSGTDQAKAGELLAGLV